MSASTSKGEAIAPKFMLVFYIFKLFFRIVNPHSRTIIDWEPTDLLVDRVII